MSRPLEDLTGRQFGRWTVLSFHSWKQNKTQRRAAWLCRCACGLEKAVEGNGLRNRETRGCYPCSRKNMASWTHIPKAVKCAGEGCGIDLVRKTHWKGAKCKACRLKHWTAYKKEADRKKVSHARRYRLICHILGWELEQFAEMFEAMKESPMAFRDKAETRVAKLEITNEKRAQKAENRRLLEAYGDGVDMEDLIERFGLTAEAIRARAERAGVPRPSGHIGSIRRDQRKSA